MTTNRSGRGFPLATGWAVLAMLCLSMPACRTIQISESNIIRPDHRPEAGLHAGHVVDRSLIQTAHGQIAVTRIHRPGNKVVVLYCGGNQFRVDVGGGWITAALPPSVDIVMFDYPGYGGSSGASTVDGLSQAALQVYDEVIAGDAAGYERRAVYGMSMGGFIASHVASERHPELLILEGTAPSVPEFMENLVPWFAKPFVSFQIAPALSRIDNPSRLRDFPGEVLLLVGDADRQTKPALMRKLARDLAEGGVDVQFHLIPGRGHGNVMGDDHARRIISEFLEEGPCCLHE